MPLPELICKRPNANVENTEYSYHPWILQHFFFTLGFSVVGFPGLFFWGYHFYTVQSPGIHRVQMLLPFPGQYTYPENSSLGANNAKAVDSIPVRAVRCRVGVKDPRGLFKLRLICVSLYEQLLSFTPFATV